MISKFLKGWYVVYVKSRQEKKVNNLLQRYRFESYLPLIQRKKKWSDRIKIVNELLFKSYVFVYINQEHEFSKVLSLDGVCKFISFSGKYTRVKDEEINNVRTLLSMNYDLIEVVNSVPKIGEKRTIQNGLFAGRECEVLKIENGRKVVVRVDSLHMQINAVLPIENLTARMIPARY